MPRHRSVPTRVSGLPLALSRRVVASARRTSKQIILTAVVGALLIGPGIISTAASTLVIPSRATSATSFTPIDRSLDEATSPTPGVTPIVVSAPPSAPSSPSPSASAAPPAPAPVQDPRGPATTLAATDRGITLNWSAPVAAAAAQYAITRTSAGAAPVTIATLPASATSYLDISVTPGALTGYSIAAQDAAGSTLGTSLPLTSTFSGVSSGTGRRYSTCPAATVGVDSSASLAAALKTVGPGSVIRLAPGTYSGQFEVGGSGSPDSPVWICGPRTAVITFGTPTDGHGLTIDGKHDIVLAGFSISNVFKGVTIIESQRITTTDLLVEKVGYEAIHLRRQTTDSEVTFTTIRSAGLVKPEYGEGIYLGTSDTNWCLYNDCKPDTTSGIRVYGNVISDTGAQAIEAKAGTSNGVIASNMITGGRSSDAWVTVKGNGWLIADNVGTTSNSYGFATNASVNGWGRDNIFARNTATGTAKFGIWIHRPDGHDSLGNLVSCLETTAATNSGPMNVSCRG